MSDNQFKDFVFQLGEPSDSSSNAPNILFGKHTMRMRRDRERELDTELIQVISDWWETSLHAMNRRAALDMLVKALSHPNVYCNPLASNLLPLSKKVTINKSEVSHHLFRQVSSVDQSKLLNIFLQQFQGQTFCWPHQPHKVHICAFIRKSENHFHLLGLSHEDTWRRVGSGLHLLHQHLQSHVQQQLSEYLQRIQRFRGQQC